MSDIMIDGTKGVGKLFLKLSENLSDMREMFTAGVQYWRKGWKKIEGQKNDYSKPLSDLIWDSRGQQLKSRWPKKREGGEAFSSSSGKLHEAQKLNSNSEVIVGTDSLKMGVKGLPYARLQHFGNQDRVTAGAKQKEVGLPTAKQIGFFFWRYRETRDKKWLAMGIMGKQGKKLQYPARPYFVTKDNKIPDRLVMFFNDYMTGEVLNLAEQIEALNDSVNLPKGVL